LASVPLRQEERLTSARSVFHRRRHRWLRSHPQLWLDHAFSVQVPASMRQQTRLSVRSSRNDVPTPTLSCASLVHSLATDRFPGNGPSHLANSPPSESNARFRPSSYTSPSWHPHQNPAGARRDVPKASARDAPPAIPPSPRLSSARFPQRVPRRLNLATSSTYSRWRLLLRVVARLLMVKRQDEMTCCNCSSLSPPARMARPHQACSHAHDQCPRGQPD
jgi:hypothetical protein